MAYRCWNVYPFLQLPNFAGTNYTSTCHYNYIQTYAASSWQHCLLLSHSQSHVQNLSTRRFATFKADIIAPESRQSPSNTSTDGSPDSNVLSYSSLLSHLSNTYTPIPVPSSSSVFILPNPQSFYTTLFGCIQSSRRRILLSALYLGTGSMEQKLVSTIQRAMKDHSQLRTHILLDFNRGNRLVLNQNESKKTEHPETEGLMNESQANQHMREGESTSSAKFLLPLVHSFPTRAHASFIWSPSRKIPSPMTDEKGHDTISLIESIFSQFFAPALAPNAALFKRRVKHSSQANLPYTSKWREAFGVHHMKYYVFDDTIILSGANLSDIYFQHRQDRYIVLYNFPALANLLEQLTEIMEDSPFTYYLSPRENSLLPNLAAIQIRRHYDVIREYKKRLIECLNIKPLSSSSASLSTSSHSVSSLSQHSTWIFPTIQIPPIGIVQDEEFTKELFRIGATQRISPLTSLLSSKTPFNIPPRSRPKLDISTGYLNITDDYLKILLDHVQDPAYDECGSLIRIIGASEAANGWYGAKGATSIVPLLYSILSFDMLKKIYDYHCQDRIRYYEYDRINWSFHSKGLWLNTHEENMPFCSMIGSSNYGRRSVYRDNEASFTILTPPNSSLSLALYDERERILNECKRVKANRYHCDSSLLSWYLESKTKKKWAKDPNLNDLTSKAPDATHFRLFSYLLAKICRSYM